MHLTQSMMSGTPRTRIRYSPFSVEAREIRELFETAFTVREVERLDILAETPKFAEIGIPALHETAVVLGRR